MNGCGPRFTPDWLKKLLGLDLFFECSCNQHDINYKVGGSELDRLKADFVFARSMIQKCSAVKWYFKPLSYIQCITFYALVTLFGWLLFNYN